jgi:hypothetical protein
MLATYCRHPADIGGGFLADTRRMPGGCMADRGRLAIAWDAFFSNLHFSLICKPFRESCQSGRMGRSRKPLYEQLYPGFESLTLRLRPPKLERMRPFFLNSAMFFVCGELRRTQTPKPPNPVFKKKSRKEKIRSPHFRPDKETYCPTKPS